MHALPIIWKRTRSIVAQTCVRYRAEASGDRAAIIGESDSSGAQHVPAQPRRRHGGRRRANTFSEGADVTAARQGRLDLGSEPQAYGAAMAVSAASAATSTPAAQTAEQRQLHTSTNARSVGAHYLLNEGSVLGTGASSQVRLIPVCNRYCWCLCFLHIVFHIEI